ncbi:cytochrome oxidase maturation protein, cbb3-type [Solimonas aquatica]|uniref:Cytochrome oxidase maturation protein, cbb3-type n=1 Tax=Solimonas aquatica TaxID=489703 RepID=A0A1H8ZM64_9GAMM|nr:cbb3-type cytochrome oxidase assembly protein CcoS [Solimonas aquatica]SEP65361.1 cytochrome oxidase maturation protein, cbb3-type [Solimonas aquatica]
MEALYILIPLGLTIIFAAGAALIWAIHSGQFENLEQAERLGLDDE